MVDALGEGLGFRAGDLARALGTSRSLLDGSHNVDDGGQT
jgi:hypothetical protein